MIVRILLTSMTLSFYVIVISSEDNTTTIEIDKKLADESLERPIKINLLSLKNSDYIEWYENGRPINITIQVEFKTDRIISNKDAIAFVWIMENQSIDNNFKLSENISFPCYKSIEFNQEDPLRGFAKLDVVNIDSPFSQLIRVRAYQVQKFTNQKLIKSYGTQYKVEEIEDEIRVTKVYNKVKLRYKQRIVLSGDPFVLDISELLTKCHGKAEIGSCRLSYIEDFFNKEISAKSMSLNETSQTFEMDTETLPLKDVELKCEMIIDRVNKIPFRVEFGVRNLVIQTLNDSVRCAISRNLVGLGKIHRLRTVSTPNSVKNFETPGESSFMNIKLVLLTESILSCIAENEMHYYALSVDLRVINGTLKEENNTIKLCEEKTESMIIAHNDTLDCSGNSLFVKAKDICSKIKI